MKNIQKLIIFATIAILVFVGYGSAASPYEIIRSLNSVNSNRFLSSEAKQNAVNILLDDKYDGKDRVEAARESVLKSMRNRVMEQNELSDSEKQRLLSILDNDAVSPLNRVNDFSYQYADIKPLLAPRAHLRMIYPNYRDAQTSSQSDQKPQDKHQPK